MESIKDKVAIVGMGCTKFGELWDKSATDLIIDAAYEACEDAGIEPNDIQAAWYGSADGLRARAGAGEGSGVHLADALKLDYKPITRVENFCATGSDTLRNACYAVAAGVYDVVLALGVEKIKDMGYGGLQTEQIMGREGTFRAMTMTPPGMFGLLALRYFDRYGIDVEEGRRLLAKIDIKNHDNGLLSPKAHLHKKITMEDVLNAPIIAWPLSLYDCCGVSDGAAAAIVTRADMAKNFRSDPVYVKALQMSSGPRIGYTHTKFDFTHVEENYRVGLVAYEEAGIKNPREEISMAQVHDCFSIHEMLIYEDLQFSPRGRARDDIEAGTFELKGKLPVNTDGGLKCFGHPIGASGLRMMYEVYKQLQGKAGPRQVKNPTLGLTHNMGGLIGGCTASCLIVGL